MRRASVLSPLWLVAALAVAAVGCGDDQASSGKSDVGAPVDAGHEEVEEPFSCVKDPVLIAEGRACVVTSDCPCGASCALGQCEAACLEDADCDEGETCDVFGQCRVPSDALLPGFSPPSSDQGLVSLSRRLLELTGVDEEATLKLTAVGGPVDAVRVVAGEGLLVGCEGAAPAGECLVEALDEGGGADLVVTLDSALANDEVRALTVYSQGAVQSVSVAGRASLSDAPEVPEAPEPPVLESGVYRGAARLVAMGVGTADEVGSGDFQPVVLPLTAEVYVDANRLVVHEPLRILHPDGVWQADFTGGDQVDFHPYRAIEGLPQVEVATHGAPVEVVVDAPQAAFQVVGYATPTLTFELLARDLGVLDAGRAPQRRWAVSLTLVEPLAEDATPPAPPAPVSLTLPLSRADAPLPWEEAAFVALDNGFSAADAVKTLGGAEHSLNACEPDRFSKEELEQAVFDRAWAHDTRLAEYVYSGPGGQPAIDAAVAAGNHIAAELLLKTSVGADPKTIVFEGWQIENMAVRRDFEIDGLDIDGVPCAADFHVFNYYRDVDPPHHGQYFFPNITGETLPALDRCEELREAYGCEPVDLPAAVPGRFALDMKASKSIDASDPVHGGETWVFDFEDYTISASFTRACRMTKRLPTRCAEYALCWEEDESLASSPLSGWVPPALGERTCEQGERSAAVSLAANEDLAAIDASLSCIHDLGRVFQTSPLMLDGQGASALRNLWASEGCIEAGRLLSALGLATEALRRHEHDPRVPVSSRPLRLAHRLLQQWIQVHGFLARESLQQQSMVHVLDRDDTFMQASHVLGQSVRGWNLMLHPRFSTALALMPGAVLAEPDYRGETSPFPFTSRPQATQPNGLPVAILKTLAVQLELAHVSLEDLPIGAQDSQLEPARNAVRYALRIAPIAHRLYERASDSSVADKGIAPAWAPRYVRAARAFDAALARTLTKLEALRTGANPLGIEEADLPLYFLGGSPQPSARFTAISDYLLNGATAWAPKLVDAADQALDEARAAWLVQAERTFNQNLSEEAARAEVEQQRQSIHFQYGEKLDALCGDDPDVPRDEVLESWQGAFNPTSCFLDQSPLCHPDESGYFQSISVQDVGRQLCTLGRLHLDHHVAIDPGIRSLAIHLAETRWPERCQTTTMFFMPRCETWGDVRHEPCVQCIYRDDSGSKVTFTGVTRAALLRADVRGVSPKALEDARIECGRLWPGGARSLSFDEAVPTSCLRGSLGQQVMNLRSIATDVDIARSAFSDHYEAYNIAMRSCLALEEGNAAIEQATASHNDTMSTLRDAKLSADVAATWCDAAATCAQAASSMTNVVSIAGAAGTCAAAAVGGEFKTKSLKIEAKMEKAEAEHAATVLHLGNATDSARCRIEAEMHLVGLNTDALRIQSAMQEFQAAQFRFEETQREAVAIYDAGLLELSSLEAREVRSFEHDRWIDEPIAAYTRKFRLAQRTAYLAVRAVEYEFQQSLGARGMVLDAKSPDDLDEALDAARQASATRNIGGRAATDLKIVLSLRRHLLQLADHGDLPDTELALSDVERFQMVLRSPRFAVFDDNGDYQGQRIPFRLAPLSALELGDPQGIAFAGDRDCAERLWSVNASILGSDDMYAGDDPSFVRLELQKSNTFYSRWCADAADQPDFQIASVRPSRNLFMDPVLGVSPATSFVAADETRLFTPARIEAYFNVSREQLEHDDYANGATSELAARGLFGDYALFFPATVLSTSTQAGQGTSGLMLEEIDDVLLRLEYVSVARGQ